MKAARKFVIRALVKLRAFNVLAMFEVVVAAIFVDHFLVVNAVAGQSCCFCVLLEAQQRTVEFALCFLESK